MTTLTLTPSEKAETVRAYVAQTTGTEAYHRSILPQLVFTDGVGFVAETCGAFWLIDAIASWQVSPKVFRADFQLWTLHAAGEGVLLEARTDSAPSGRLLTTQAIEYSDFPRELLPFKLWVEGGVLLLPEEH